MYRKGDAIRCGYDFNPNGPFLNRLEGRAGNIFLVDAGLVVQLPLVGLELPARVPGLLMRLEAEAEAAGLTARRILPSPRAFRVRNLEPRPILMTRKVAGVLKTYYGHAFGTDSDIIIFFPFDEQVALMAVDEVLGILGAD